MKRWWSSASIRTRLTTWYVLAMCLMLLVYASATYVAVRHEFYEQLEDQHREERTETLGPSRASDRVEMQLREILVVLVLGIPLIVALAGVGGYVLARRALEPIDHLASEARRVTAERLHERLSLPNEHDEIGRLAAVFNETFARLDASFAQLRRFTSDASHELRTPLAVIRGIGEMGLRETRTVAEYKDAMGSMLEEVDRLTRLVDTLLRLSRADASTLPLRREAVDLGQLVGDAASSLAVLAEERNQQLQFDLASGVIVDADPLILREAITNVVDNAIKYSPHRSVVGIHVATTPNGAIVRVTDEGPGISPEHRGRVFDRFYRVDEGRSRQSGGSGLGLAIAKWAVESNGGRITFENLSPGGSAFEITLPLISHTQGSLHVKKVHDSKGEYA